MVYVPRANASFPSSWISLRWSPESGDPSAFLASALRSGVPVDLTRNAPLWRSGLKEEAFIVCRGGREGGNAENEEHAASLVEAAIFQVSCSLGQQIGAYFLDVDSRWTASQMNGALAALELARTDEIIQFAGLASEDADSVSAAWENNDGFEFVLLPAEAWTPELLDKCKQRGVASVASMERSEAGASMAMSIKLIAVRSLEDIELVPIGRQRLLE